LMEGVHRAQFLDRVTQLAVGAASLAATDARLGRPQLADGAVIVGSGFGCIPSVHEAFVAFAERGGIRGTRAYMVPKAMPNAPAAAISMHLGMSGTHHVVAAACASGLAAIANAARLIQWGRAPVAIAGGSDAPVIPAVLASWCALRVLSTFNDEPCAASRTFSADRTGLVLDEGAAMLVLEDYQRARARGARIYAEIAGSGESSDAYHLTAPSQVGQARAVRQALLDAHVSPTSISHISAHGTATKVNDGIETAAIKEVFGNHAARIAVSATKSIIGHAMGAGAAIEAAAAVLAVYHQCAPPTANLSTPDPECDLDYVTDGPRDLAIDYAVKQSFGFGGANVALVIARSVS